jgi:hypothetical protein
MQAKVKNQKEGTFQMSQVLLKTYESMPSPTGGTELVASVKLDGALHVVQSLPIEGISAGQSLFCSAEQEFTNNETKPEWLGVHMVLASTPTATTGEEVTPPNGCNVTEDGNGMHHYTITRAKLHIVKTPLPSAYLNLVAASAASSLPTTDIIQVDPKTGTLSCGKFG